MRPIKRCSFRWELYKYQEWEEKRKRNVSKPLYCPECGTDNEEGTTHCKECGSPLKMGGRERTNYYETEYETGVIRDQNSELFKTRESYGERRRLLFGEIVMICFTVLVVLAFARVVYINLFPTMNPIVGMLVGVIIILVVLVILALLGVGV